MAEGIRDIMFIEFCICQMFVSSSTGQYTIQTLVVTCYFVFSCNMTMESDVYFCVIRVSYTQEIQYLNSSVSTSYTNADFSHLKYSGNASYIEPDDVSENIYRFTSQFHVEFALLSLCYLIPMWSGQQTSISGSSELDVLEVSIHTCPGAANDCTPLVHAQQNQPPDDTNNLSFVQRSIPKRCIPQIIQHSVFGIEFNYDP